MSVDYVRSCLARQERDTSGECRWCALKDKRIAELEAELAPLEGRSVTDLLKYVDSLEQKILRDE